MSENRRSWLAVAAVMFGVGWGANQFTSLLIAYHQHLGLTLSVDEALFGIYALGLIPALLVGGPASDRWGRRTLVRPAAVMSVAATVVLMVGAQSTPLLFVGRFLAGTVSGAVFAAGTAWVK
jgi:MFS family permease